MSKDEAYLRVLRTDKEEARAYHTKSVVKTEQQKALEGLLSVSAVQPKDVADLACGGGSLSYHLKALYPDARFTLCDLDPFALELAEKLNGRTGFSYRSEDLNTLAGLDTGSFDLVCCWQTLLAIHDPQGALEQMIRIARPGGRIYCSSLFNLDHDLDMRTEFRDYTRPSGAAGQWAHYSTYCRRTVEGWLRGKVTRYTLHPFMPNVDITTTAKGLGTYTVNSEKGRLQISGGILMNWAILEIVK